MYNIHIIIFYLFFSSWVWQPLNDNHTVLEMTEFLVWLGFILVISNHPHLDKGHCCSSKVEQTPSHNMFRHRGKYVCCSLDPEAILLFCLPHNDVSYGFCEED